MIDALLKNMSVAWPSILIGALIPCGALLALYCSKERKSVAFKATLYGFASFFMSLIAVVALVLLAGDFFLSGIAITSESDAESYINIFGLVILLLFYLFAEAIKYFTFESLEKHENRRFAGLTYGCGFILAQNLLVFGVVYFGNADIKQALGFGVLMMISAIIYLLISMVGYQLAVDRHRVVGPVLAVSYYLMFAVMLLFANVYVTYSFIAAVLLFNLMMAYFILPHPFKKKKEASVDE